MKHLETRVAVVTGAASGIGRELAIACARRGMRVVLADVDLDGLSATKASMTNCDVRMQRCDVSSLADVQALADLAFGQFGNVHVLFNNAGVATLGPVWSATPEDWNWVLGVNLLGVAHGIQSFVPRMIAAGEEGRIVNTSSAAGLAAVAGSGVYCASKHAVVALSECLREDLKLTNSKLGVSVLCPSLVKTAIADSQRNRPSHLAATNPGSAPFDQRVRAGMDASDVSAAEVAEMTLEAVCANQFYILPHPGVRTRIEQRFRDIVDHPRHHTTRHLASRTDRT